MVNKEKIRKLIQEEKKEEKRTGKRPEYIYAFDPKIQRRVVHVVRNGIAISLITQNKFKYKPKK